MAARAPSGPAGHSSRRDICGRNPPRVGHQPEYRDRPPLRGDQRPEPVLQGVAEGQPPLLQQLQGDHRWDKQLGQRGHVISGVLPGRDHPAHCPGIAADQLDQKLLSYPDGNGGTGRAPLCHRLLHQAGSTGKTGH